MPTFTRTLPDGRKVEFRETDGAIIRGISAPQYHAPPRPTGTPSATLTEAAARAAERAVARGGKFNPDYNTRLLLQGYTHDPSTGHAIPGADTLVDSGDGAGPESREPVVINNPYTQPGAEGADPEQLQQLAEKQSEDAFAAPAPNRAVISGVSAEDRPTLLKARRNAKALHEGFVRGDFDEQQLQGALESLEKETPKHLLIRIPEYQELTGAQGVLQEQQQQAVAAAEQQRRLPEGSMIWDEDAGRPVIDPVWKEADAIRREHAKIAAQPRVNQEKAELDAIERGRKASLDALDKKFLALKDTGNLIGAAQFYEREANAINERYDQERNKIFQGATITPNSGQTAEAPQAPSLTHPKLPAGAALRGKFSNAAEARAAGVKPGEYFMLGPYLARVDRQGQLQKVD